MFDLTLRIWSCDALIAWFTLSILGLLNTSLFNVLLTVVLSRCINKPFLLTCKLSLSLLKDCCFVANLLNMTYNQ